MRPHLFLLAAAAASALAGASFSQALPADGGGGYWRMTKTIDMAVQQVVADPDRSLSVIVSVKNNATYDFRPTPGDFVPNLTLADGEAFTSRELFRAADPATAFRPTIAPGAEVKIRFIFRKAKGMAEPKTFSVTAGSGPTQTLDVSSARWTSTAP